MNTQDPWSTYVMNKPAKRAGERVAIAQMTFGKYRLIVGDDWNIRDGY